MDCTATGMRSRKNTATLRLYSHRACRAKELLEVSAYLPYNEGWFIHLNLAHSLGEIEEVGAAIEDVRREFAPSWGETGRRIGAPFWLA